MTLRLPLSAGAPRLWSIPAGRDFLGDLAATLSDVSGLAANPAALSNALIYVPNRRSARGLALKLLEASGQPTILPPDIRALGDLETDEPPSGAEEALTDLGPALPSAQRTGELARLVRGFYEARGLPLPAVSAISAARELARLLDQAALSGGVDWSRLPDLVDDTDLATHWQQSVAFLEILVEHWPAWLAANQVSEPFERRMIVAEAIAASVSANPPRGPFVVAGSTGATPASRRLMQAALGLDKGLVVLPGLDRSAPAEAWAAIGDEPDHPQSALAGTLVALGTVSEDVAVWPGSSAEPQSEARRRLIHESLTPAALTADWLVRLKDISGEETPDAFVRRALGGLSLIEAADEADEARLAALLLREALEVEGQTAALITPDAGLARQVAALLERWHIDVAPTAGLPLGRTGAGSFLLLVAHWACDTGDPVRLLSLLKHSLVEADATGIAALDAHYLRGPRIWGVLSDLVRRLPELTAKKAVSRHTAVPPSASSAAGALIQGLMSKLGASEGALSSDADMLASDIADQLIGLVETLTGSSTAAWAGPDGAAAARCLEETAALIAPLGPVSPTTFAEILRHQAASLSVPEPGRTHPRLSIWGPLEARLQQADRVILAGLNEDVWPQRPPADAFLPRRFRTALGLAAPEDRLGLAAHDFAQLASAPDVTLLYSARREDAPAVASRWALRLKTLVQGALGADVASVLEPAEHRDPRIWAEALMRDRQDFDAKSAAPRPTPPVAARPDRLSVTRIGTLQRDPYAIYAEYVLRLKKLRPLAEPIDLSLRGTAIHAAIEAFDALDDKAQTADRLAGLIETALHNAGQPQHLILAERASLGAAARQLYAWWDERRARVTGSAAEVRGELEWQIAGAPFRLTGVADRVEQQVGGHLAIFDFKTGRVPSLKEVKAGFEQQLPLLALMAREGRLGQWPAADVGELGYVAVKTAFDARPIAWDPDETADLMRLAQETIEKLITNYRDPTAPFLSVPRVQLKSAYAGDYDRLARRSEWAGAVGDGDG